MKKPCSICNDRIDLSDAEPFTVRATHGYLCPKHSASFELAVTAWVVRATADTELERKIAEDAERTREERRAASIAASNIAEHRMAQLALEGLPVATRRVMRKRGIAA